MSEFEAIMRTIASLKANSEECAQIMDVTSSDKASHPCIKKPRDPIAKSTLGYRIMAAAAQDYLASNIVSSIDESSDCLPLLQEAVHCSDQEQQQQRGQHQVLAPGDQLTNTKINICHLESKM